MARYLYSTAVKTLTDVVKEFNLAQGNLAGNHFVSTLNHAKWIWKDLNFSNFWGVVQTAVPVIDGKITLPENVSRLLNISVIDKCGNIQPLGYNPSVNTYALKCPTKTCSCKCGGNGTYCGDLSSIDTQTEQVVIESQEYTKTTYTRHDGMGNIVREVHAPVWDVDTQEVVYLDSREVIFTVEINQDGCILSSEPNRRKLVEFCGCYIPYPFRARCETGLCSELYTCHRCKTFFEPYKNEYGHYNWSAEAGNVIHLYKVDASQVLLVYQSNGELDGVEVLVPEYAVDAMMMGIMYRQRALSNIYPISEKQYAKQQYNVAKRKLYEFLNPLRMDDFVKLGGVIPKWG